MIFFLIALLVVGGTTAYFYNHQSEGGDPSVDQVDTTSVPNGTGDSTPPPKPLTTDSGDVVNIAIEIIKDFEGFSPIPYDDPPGSGKRSIGYGHQIQPGENFTRISETQAINMLALDVSKSFACVIDKCKVALTTNQAAALTSFCYNIGCSAFGGSTLLQKLNNNDYTGAANELPKWIRSGGQISSALVARRQEEKDLFEAA